jgi:hypothetical protein
MLKGKVNASTVRHDHRDFFAHYGFIEPLSALLDPFKRHILANILNPLQCVFNDLRSH